MAIEVNSPSLWIPESKATLYRVPWDSGYENVVEAFKDVTYRDLYFANLTAQGESFVVSQNTYFRPGQPVDVPVPYDRAYTYNYLVVENPPQQATEDHADSTLKLYYFIVNADYASPQVTTLTLQLDVWTTYRWSCEFGAAYVERGHIGMANISCNFGEGGVAGTCERVRDYLGVPEGLTTGTQQLTYGQYAYNFNTADHGYVIVSATVDLSQSPGDVTNPTLTMASGCTVDGIWNCQNLFAVPATKFADFVSGLQDVSWIAQCVQCMYYVPVTMIDELSLADVGFLGSTETEILYKFNSDKFDVLASIPLVPVEGIETSSILESLPARFRKYYKLLSYPYTVIEVDTFSGAPLDIGVNNCSGTVINFGFVCCITQPFARYGVFPNYSNNEIQDGTASTPVYNANGSSIINVYPGDWLNNAAWFSDFPQLPLLNDSYQLYMASNANAIKYQYEQVDTQYAKTNRSIDVSRQTQLNTLNTQNENFQRDLVNQQNALQIQKVNDTLGIVSSGVGAIGSAVTGNVGGAVSGIVSTAAGALTAGMQWQQSQNELNTSRINQQAMMQTNLTNLDLNTSNATWAANLDKEMAIKGILATQADARNTPPATVGMMGGNGFLLSLGLQEVLIRIKHPSYGDLARICQYFDLYGYEIDTYLDIPRDGFLVCENMSYWKCANIVISDMEGDETAKDAMRAIFIKGVTVWANPDIIGNRNSVQNNDPIVKPYYTLGRM